MYSQDAYLVLLKSKNISECKLALSKESIERKLNRGIEIDDKDFCIDKDRIQIVQSIAPILKSSNWLNGLMVKATEKELVKIKALEFVKSIELMQTNNPKKSSASKFETLYSEKEYGESFRQISIHNGDYLHSANFQGNGMKIAVFDAGFREVNKIQSFEHLFLENRIFPIFNLVYNNTDLYSADMHGTGVLGCMASYYKDTIVGSAPKANYYLFITEDVRSESKIEELNWAIAAQMADSIGVDIINSSLGYTEFDDVQTNYKTSDMNGRTSISSKAAGIACAKGIIVVNSAGNLGAKNWRVISAPSDHESVMTIGSIDSDMNISEFSSRGWNANGDIKPNIVGIGRATNLYYNDGEYFKGSGTSFSSPTLAGLIACLWQKNPSWTADQVKKSIYESASNFTFPNKDYGFGIPDFKKAGSPILAIKDTLKVNVYPNPTMKSVIVEFNSEKEVEESVVELFQFNKSIHKKKIFVKKGYNQIILDLNEYSSGLFFIRVKIDNYYISGKFEKI